MRFLAAYFLSVLLWVTSASAAPNFPDLTGPVVDSAEMISYEMEQHIADQLVYLEADTHHQLVVVTIPTLDGYDIADYGYQLGRHWGIGQAEHDNGVLVIVARDERLMRIEVGYGLEGLVPDAVAHNIIHKVMRPKFKQGQYADGILAATEVLDAALREEPIPESLRKYSDTASTSELANVLFFAGVFVANMFRKKLKTKPAKIAVAAGGGVLHFLMSNLLPVSIFFSIFLLAVLFGSNSGGPGGRGGRRGGGFGGPRGRLGGGFRGGGGSFGGGGASGGW